VPAKKRKLNNRQQELAVEARKFIQPAINTFVKRNPDLRASCRRVDMVSVASVAVCMAAFTYKKSKSKPTTYFGSAIRHALYRAVLQQQKQDGRYIPTECILDPLPHGHRTRQEMKAMKALRLLTMYDRTLLEDRLIEQVTLEQLSKEQHCDPRTVSKRVKRAISRLKKAVSNLP
jgi:RNA polymerase sigma factor (sigma-70 family)|tara:strand:- start:4985 stop:5509 length:525 start_codon:yes stop_codon:yes gene_type:complete